MASGSSTDLSLQERLNIYIVFFIKEIKYIKRDIIYLNKVLSQ